MDPKILDDNELLENAHRNVFAYAYFNINNLIKEFPAAKKIECEKKLAIYNEYGDNLYVDDDDLLGFIRMRSMPYPLTVKKFEDELKFAIEPAPLEGRNGTVCSALEPIIVEINENPEYYKYDVAANVVEFYVSFADRAFFGWFYRNNLALASEEVRALEFPVVCSLRFCLEDIYEHGNSVKWKRVISKEPNSIHPVIDPSTHEIFQPVTSDGANRPTPIILIGTPRLGELKTDGIYGKKFQKITPDVAARRLHPITGSKPKINFISMEALEQKANPVIRRGAYTIHQLRTLLRTAMTGFAGARATIQPQTVTVGAETKKIWPEMIINTGLWGCGEYGNNPGVICLIQLAAAHFVGSIYDQQTGTAKPAIQRLIFYIGEDNKDKALILEGIDLFYSIWNEKLEIRSRTNENEVVPDLFLYRVEQELKLEKYENKYHWREKNDKA
ncbi:hypothetical protein HK098_003333 [Nowakowskiella sp. JEL0407]|nr:hypothetical protein HK098_003333 [Nowakowskiella sp. JEL0407]